MPYQSATRSTPAGSEAPLAWPSSSRSSPASLRSGRAWATNAPPMAYDVIIIGGGVNGLGTARDCAMRGLSVLLLEKRDLASGASGANSGMIHGGIRYMLSDRRVTELACRDS